MNQQMFVLSPCGTSLLTNQASDEERKLVSKYANTKESKEIPKDDIKVLDTRIQLVKEKLKNADLELASRMSAELNGIIKLYNNQFDNQYSDYHVLLCTDTWLGEQTATLVNEWLKSKNIVVEVKRQKDLQTLDINSFQLALSELVQWSEESLSGYRKSGYHIVFNLTGGFKSVQGFLQTLANFYADETIYVFETAKDLLRIPGLPIKMVAEETIKNNLAFFRRLSLDLSITDINISDVPETLLMRIDNQISLSPWGELVWQKHKKDIYREKIHPSPSGKLKFSKQFEKSVDEEVDRLVMINERIDQLVKYLEKNGDYNPQSLDFKQLKGNPSPPSTHEIDAWSDGNARRLFGHYEEEYFILDKLGRHL
jgi:putative CRISPR-associated protein (TIGR02619 family)